MTAERAVAPDVDVLLWFTTATCASCHDLAPHLEEFARRHGGRVPVRTVDAQTAGPLAERYQVASFPTLVLLHRGARVWQRAGRIAGSVEALEALVLPVVQRLERRPAAGPDVSPPAPLPRPGRVVTVPAAPRTSVDVAVVAPGEQTAQRLPPGAHRLPRGARLVVTLRADHRRQPPLDLALLGRLEPGSVDELEVVGHPVTARELGAYQALRELVALLLWTGPAQVAPGDLDAFPRLAVLETDPAWPAPALPGVVVNGDWELPELRSLLPAAGAPSAGPGSGPGPGPGPGPGSEGWPALDEVGDDDRERSREGTVLLAFADRSSQVAQDVLQVLADRTPRGGPPVLAVDAARSPVLAAEHEVAVVPTLLLLRDGLPLWRTSAVLDAASCEQLLAPVLSWAAAPQGRPPAGRPLPPAAARPGRRLRLPDGPLPYQLHLHPPRLPASSSTCVLEGGPVEVPRGWTTHVTVDPATGGFRWSALEVFGAHDLDALHYLDTDDDPALLRQGLPALAAMVGLRTLEVVSDSGAALVADLLPVLATLSELRVLSIEPATDEADGPDEAQLARLRAALPGTVVNGEWSALTPCPVPRQRQVAAPSGAGRAHHQEEP